MVSHADTEAADTHTVRSTTVGNEPKQLQLVHKVLQRPIDNAVQLALYQALDDPKRVPIILLPEPSTGNNKRVIERYECARACRPVADQALIGGTNERGPVPVNDLHPGPNERVRDVVQERGGGVELVAEKERFELLAFAGEIGIDEVRDCTFRRVCGVYGGEGLEDGLGGLGYGRLVDERFGVRVQLRDVDSLKDLRNMYR